jgi:hypothetical protein
MNEIFPEPIQNLPEADIPLDGAQIGIALEGERNVLVKESSITSRKG